MKNTVAVVLVALLCSSSLALAQAGQKPAGQKPAPSTRKPATAKPAPAKPAPAVKPAPPPAPTDIRFKSRYTTGDQVTEGMTYLRGNRERYELGDMILLRQHDLKQTVQISRASNTYLIAPDAAGDGSAAALMRTKGVRRRDVETSIADVGERKPMFGQQARHVMTVIDRQPQAGACDQSKQRMETDAWYIDAPKALAAQPPSSSSIERRRMPRRHQGHTWLATPACSVFPWRTRRRLQAPTASRSSSCRWKSRSSR